MSDEKPQKTFYESWMSLGLMIALIVIGRVYFLEPFKIPSGSMEPTLIGHEDFGDRILTNKLAFVKPWQAWAAFGVALILILQGLIWAVDFYRKPQVITFAAVMFVVALRIVRALQLSFYHEAMEWIGLAVFGVLAIHTVYWYATNFREVPKHKSALRWALIGLIVLCGGMGFAWTRDAVASEPHRFDVTVFEYNTGWVSASTKDQNINYIKRLTGLPGDRITISGGDLFLYDKASGKNNIIRKWDVRGDELQDALWFPVSKAFEPRFNDPKLVDPTEEAVVKSQLRDLAFPWSGAEENASGVKLENKALVLDGTAPVKLEYKFPVTNIYLKQGRWPFIHEGCPAANLPSAVSPDGVRWRNPNASSDHVDAFVSNTWEGVQCPNCKHVYFPIQPDRDLNNVTPPPYPDGTRLLPGPVRFFYGGPNKVGDLKLDLKLNVKSAGSLRIELGNALRRAVWNIPGGGKADEDGGNAGKTHYVQKQTAALAPGEHTLSFAYVDGTVIARLDGVEQERRPIEVAPLPDAAHNAADTAVKLELTGVAGEITLLNLSRDLFWTQGAPSPFSQSRRDDLFRRRNAAGNYEFEVPADRFLMMGDNSPSSQDGRVWGFVPRERLLGRAGSVWWPPSRWKIIK